MACTRDSRESTVLVFDLGGGTFDVTLMNVKGQEMTILATNGDHRLGGKDWDDKIILHVAKTFEDTRGENLLSDLTAYYDLQARAVEAKIQLSTLSRATIIVNYAGKSQRVQLTRQAFEDMTTDLVERCRSLVDVVLDEVGLTTTQIDTVLLVGGSTRLPAVQDMLTEHFGKPPDTSVNPDEAVVFGAAVMGELLPSEAPKKHFIGGTPEVPKQNFGITRIKDVCSHSLGMAVLDELGELRNSTIIPKNTHIPCDISRDDYLTTSPDQTEFDVIVLQGDADLDPRDCPVCNAYEVFDIPPRPAGETRLEVTFKYNANGVIEVEAADVNSKVVLPIRKKLEEIDWDALLNPKSASMPMDIALVIDCSGSMAGDEIRDAKNAAVQFLKDIDPSWRVGLVSFGGSLAKIEMALTQNFEALRRAIRGIEIRGSTPMTQAIEVTRKELLNSRNVNVLILLTDGYPDHPWAALPEAELAKEKGIRIITIGVGYGVDSDYLKQIASTPEDYYFVEESVQLESIFTTVASRLVTESSGHTSGITGP